MEPPPISTWTEPSLAELAMQALNERLVDSCEFTRETTTIVQGNHRCQFPHAQARIYLLGLLRGWWSCSLNLPNNSAPSPVSEPVTKATVYPIEPREENESNDLEHYLDLLLEFSKKLDVIADANKDPSSHTVKVYVPAMASGHLMSYTEAVEFLSRCLEDELRSQRD